MHGCLSTLIARLMSFIVASCNVHYSFWLFLFSQIVKEIILYIIFHQMAEFGTPSISNYRLFDFLAPKFNYLSCSKIWAKYHLANSYSLVAKYHLAKYPSVELWVWVLLLLRAKAKLAWSFAFRLMPDDMTWKDWCIRVGRPVESFTLLVSSAGCQAGGDANAPLVAKALLHLTRNIIKLVSGQSNKSVFFEAIFTIKWVAFFCGVMEERNQNGRFRMRLNGRLYPISSHY